MAKTQVVSFHCILRDPMGRVISSSFNHDVLAKASARPAGAVLTQHAPHVSHFDFHEPIQELVESLKDVKKGERRTIFVNAEHAYGLYDPNLVMQMSRKKLPQGENLEIGFQIVTQAPDGECRVFRVTAVDGLSVTLDGNHPLAGQDLCFDIEATAIREATDEEELGQAKITPRPAHQHH